MTDKMTFSSGLVGIHTLTWYIRSELTDNSHVGKNYVIYNNIIQVTPFPFVIDHAGVTGVTMVI